MLYAAIEQAPSEEVVEEEEVAQRYLARCGWVGVRLPSSVSPPSFESYMDFSAM